MIKSYFEQITDARQSGKIAHILWEILVMGICATIAGMETMPEIAMYCRSKEQWFRNYFGMTLPNGVPSHDTFLRVFGLIDEKQVENCFVNWINSLKPTPQGEIISIDGKELRGSKTNSKTHSNHAVRMVSAWANERNMVIGQVKTSEKSNEITAIPELLNMLDIKGCTITMDAMGCQKKIVDMIIEKQANYTLGLKGNQGNLHDDVKLYFTDALKDSSYYPEIKQYDTKNKTSGRMEYRHYFYSEDISWLANVDDWKGIRGIGMVRSTVIYKGKTTIETRYFVSSLNNVVQFADAVRKHWAVENSLHYELDVVYHEDQLRFHTTCAHTLAVIRHIAHNGLKNMPDKSSVKTRRKRCSFDDGYLCKVLEVIGFMR